MTGLLEDKYNAILVQRFWLGLLGKSNVLFGCWKYESMEL